MRKKWWGHVTRMGQMRNSYETLVGKLQGKSPVERTRRRWKYNTRIIRMDLKVIGVRM
jgi:hypothetical protein